MVPSKVSRQRTDIKYYDGDHVMTSTSPHMRLIQSNGATNTGSRKPKCLGKKICHSAYFFTSDPTWANLLVNPGSAVGKPAVTA
jgi:hypothetical protein